jgi:hypothetical protein
MHVRMSFEFSVVYGLCLVPLRARTCCHVTLQTSLTTSKTRQTVRLVVRL